MSPGVGIVRIHRPRPRGEHPVCLLLLGPTNDVQQAFQASLLLVWRECQPAGPRANEFTDAHHGLLCYWYSESAYKRLFVGPPGTGKSMLARRLPGILPPLSEGEALETAAVDSIIGRRFDLTHWRQRPFRCPHHTASAAALVGGGSDPRPGEISRAHNGVLFLDELPEFSRHVLEVLREPMETGWITISRAGRQADFPARFQLVAAMNPCPCGYQGDPRGDCRCSAERVVNYRGKISGPLLDRIDIQLPVRRLAKEALRPNGDVLEGSATVRERVSAARQRQQRRAGTCNARLEGNLLEDTCGLTREGWTLLERAMDRFALSARAHQRIRRVARTIADLAGDDIIAAAHVGEALSLRLLTHNVRY